MYNLTKEDYKSGSADYSIFTEEQKVVLYCFTMEEIIAIAKVEYSAFVDRMVSDVLEHSENENFLWEYELFVKLGGENLSRNVVFGVLKGEKGVFSFKEMVRFLIVFLTRELAGGILERIEEKLRENGESKEEEKLEIIR